MSNDIEDFLNSKFKKKPFSQSQSLPEYQSITEFVDLPKLKASMRPLIIFAKIVGGFFILIFVFWAIAVIEIEFEQGEYKLSPGIFILLIMSATFFLIRFYLKKKRSERNPELLKEALNQGYKTPNTMSSPARIFIESSAYQEIFKVYSIIFTEKNIFTREEITRFIDNEHDLFNASYQRIKKDSSSYIDEKTFRELVLKWSDRYMNEKIQSLFNTVSRAESAVVEKYISAFGQFKDYVGIVQSSLNLGFNLESALDRKLEGLKTLQNESLLKEILAKGSYGKNQISIDDLDFMEGIEFEHFLSVLFRKMGYKTEVTKASGDQGVDLILHDINFKYAVQAKRYSDKVSNSAIQEVFAGMKFYNCNKAMVVTTNYFTPSAVALAQKNGVELFDRDKLNDLLLKHVIYQSDIEAIETVED